MKYFVLLFITFCVTAPSYLPAQIFEDPRQHSLILRGIDRTLQQEYDSAETVFKQFIKENPSHPAGYLYLAGMLQAKNTDYGDWFNEKRYDSLLNVVRDLSQPFIKNTSTAAAGYYYQGSSEAFRSYTKSENGNLASGIYYGLSAGSSLERCLELDSNYTEAKDILGSFYFWRSKLAWIPFVSDRSEEGISMIKQSFSHPYEKHLASHNLMVILTEQKRYAEAERYGMLMLKEYPDNRLFLWNLMTVYEKWDRKKEMIEIVRRLLQSTLNAKVTNRYTEAVCRLKLAQNALALNDRESAKKELNSILVLERFAGRTKGDLKKKLSQAEDLLETIQ
ncbi:MAG: tetratricopeptide repeat protein [Bacteroidota bacterium]